jgi:hypothetical protein
MTEHCRGGCGEKGKDDGKQITLAPLLFSIFYFYIQYLFLKDCDDSTVIILLFIFLALLAVSSHWPLFDCFFDGPAFCFFQIITVYDETTIEIDTLEYQ